MARNLISAGLLQLVRDGAVALPAGQASDVNDGQYVADPAGPNKIAAILVKNGDTSSHSVIIRAGGNGVTQSGGTNPGVPFEQATVGDLTVAVAASATEVIRLGDTDRYTQADGCLYIDWSSGTPTTVLITVLVEPYNAIAV